MDAEQKKMWEEWPLKIMVGQCNEGYGFKGFDVAFMANNEAVSIKLKDLFLLVKEFMEKGYISDFDEAGLLIVLGSSDHIHNIPLKGVVNWEDSSVNTN